MGQLIKKALGMQSPSTPSPRRSSPKISYQDLDVQIGVLGLGRVGIALYESLRKHNVSVVGYDKNQIKSKAYFTDLLNCTLIFVCLPTPWSFRTHTYDKSALDDALDTLYSMEYKGLVVVKSSVEPATCEHLITKYRTRDLVQHEKPNTKPTNVKKSSHSQRSISNRCKRTPGDLKLQERRGLRIIHNPAFLAVDDQSSESLHQQDFVVIGAPIEERYTVEFESLIRMLRENYTHNIYICEPKCSELMKLVLDAFYAVKIQYFTDVYLLCRKLGVQYDHIKDLVQHQGSVAPNHMDVDGYDGDLHTREHVNALFKVFSDHGIPASTAHGAVRDLVRYCK